MNVTCFRLRITNQRFNVYPPVWCSSQECVPLVTSLNNPMTQEWIHSALTSASKSVPVWNVNIGICFQMVKASSCKIHAWMMRFQSDGWCVSTVMDPFRTDWANLRDRVPPNNTACSLSASCMKNAFGWIRHVWKHVYSDHDNDQLYHSDEGADVT